MEAFLTEPVAEDDLCVLDGATGCRAVEEGYEVVAADAQRAVVSLLGMAQQKGLRVKHLDVKGADLEDVFLSMTGRKLSDEDEQAAEYRRAMEAFGPERPVVIRLADIGGDKALPPDAAGTPSPFASAGPCAGAEAPC